MDNETIERIEKEAKEFAGGPYKKNHFPVHWNKAFEGYRSGATAERSRITELLKQERNKVIDEAIEKVQIRFYNTPRNKDMVDALDTCLDVLRSLKGKQQ